MTPHLTRRELLAGTAAVTTAAVGFRAFVGESVALTQAAAAGDLRFRWREARNGRVVEDTSFSRGASPGPRLSVDNVLPGDSGSLTLAVSLGQGAEPLALTLRVDDYENAENGVNEPEAVAGDPGAPGELGGAIRAACWFDAGVLGVRGAGDRNARRELTEPLVAPGADGSLDDVAAALDDGVPLSPDGGCLGPGEEVAVTLAWSLPASTGNRVQGDGVSFTLAVAPSPCGQEEQ